jgi:nicotinamide mononucleotide transporter
MESALQIFYVAMAVYGWYQWKRGGDDGRGLHIVTWRFRTHALVIGGVAILSIGVGWAMTATDAVFPYLDSFTTVAAVVTTYMVARKVLENWVYWFVIDSVAIYLYIARELYLTSALFIVYLVLVVAGFRRWRHEWRAEAAAEA